MNGIFSALVVPFDEHGEIIEKGLREVVRHNIDVQQIDGLYVNGSTGENFLMNTEQKKQVFRIVQEESQGAITLIAQIGSLDIYEAIDLGIYARDLGYDSLSAVTPYYYPFSFEEIKNYYLTLVKETNHKMIIYSIPALTGVHMNMNQFDELLQEEQIIGVKYTAGDFFLLERLRQRYPNKMIFSGFDEMLIHGTVSGVDGAIGSTYNVNGRKARRIFELAQEGNVAEAYQLQHETNDLIESLLDIGIYQAIKGILREQGVQAGLCKAPLTPRHNVDTTTMQQLIKKHQL
ncbi:N-acetylneuraminate lyase [Marinococcus halophilus]|uniref:N-acetylneuraminate lyase n=1 Tax=Marinococcus halophilus TaxID=1371 RepID=A0A510Y7W6_MARHA|nr:N-acetylneuraminate lyase [Marinococcus halophilus]OZT79602.1 N-acetylneuraminate lyase [Marinococcus halophilus]GEK59464.1 N-acetylneuraminate lyase [Marinococcus halophilus]